MFDKYFFWNSFLCGEYFNQISMLHLTFSETAVKKWGDISRSVHSASQKNALKYQQRVLTKQ
jgi:hypothetical protein